MSTNALSAVAYWSDRGTELRYVAATVYRGVSGAESKSGRCQFQPTLILVAHSSQFIRANAHMLSPKFQYPAPSPSHDPSCDPLREGSPRGSACLPDDSPFGKTTHQVFVGAEDRDGVFGDRSIGRVGRRSGRCAFSRHRLLKVEG